MQETPDPYQSILDSLPDGILWALPVFHPDGSIEDFEVKYVNSHIQDNIAHSTGSLLNLRILRDQIPTPETFESNFTSYLKVYQTGEPTELTVFIPHTQRFVDIYRKKHNGGVLNITRDRKGQREAERKEQEKTRLLNGIVSHAPVGIEVYESIRDSNGQILDFRVKLYNEQLHELTGLPAEERSRLTLKELLKRLDSEEYFARYHHLVETGEPFEFDYFSPAIQGWLHLSAVKLGDGFLVLLSDISQIKAAQQAIEQQSQYLSSILNTSLNAVVTMEAIRNEEGQIIDMRYRQVNDRFLQWLSITEAQALNHTMLDLFPATKDYGIFELYRNVIETGKPQRAEVPYQLENAKVWYDVSVARLDSNTLVGTFNDITRSKTALEQVEQQRNLLDNILKHSSNGISVTRLIRDAEGRVIDGRTILANDAAVRFTGLPRELYLTKTAVELDPGIIDSPYFQRCMETLETGISQHSQYFLESVGTWLDISISRMDGDHLITIFTDVTAGKEAQLAIEKSAAQLHAIINRTQSGVFTLTPVTNEEGVITDFQFGIVNRALAAYVKQEPETLIGQPGSQWFTGYRENGLFDLFLSTYETGEMSRFDFHYLADGIDAWIDMMCTRFGGELLVTFTDYTPVKKLQLQLQSLVEELRRSNASLEEFAYAASHDLKEPVRKVRFFAERLQEHLKGKLEEEDNRLLGRMEIAAARMNSLIDDLLLYSQVSVRPLNLEPVNLNEVVELVLDDLELEIEQKKAQVSFERLPVVQGQGRQLQQLLHNLIGNALKYNRPGVSPLVEITCSTVNASAAGIPDAEKDRRQTFHAIAVKDNGIGFAPEEAERIFQVFTRLHGNSEYKGTGVGLSIVRKVAENHGGYVTARGEPGAGATFTVYLPVKVQDTE